MTAGRRGPLHEPDDARHPVLEPAVGADELGLREPPLPTPNELVRVIAELDGADALRRRRNENRSERAFADREANVVARTARSNSVGVMPSNAFDTEYARLDELNPAS